MAQKKSALNEFYIDGNDADVSHVLLHIAEPVSAEEKRKGIFFAVVELRQVSQAGIRAVENLIQHIETVYYGDSTLENDVAWENSLRIGNDAADKLNTKGEIHACLATLSEGTLRLTYHGEPLTWILYPHQAQFKVYNIIKGHEPAEERFFSDIIEGELKLGHRALVAAPSLLKIINQERFIKINVERTANSAAYYLQRFLEGIKNGLSYGGLIFEWRKDPQRPDSLTVQHFQSPGDSLKGLANQEKQTEQMLASSLGILLRTWKERITHYIHALANHNATPSEIAPPQRAVMTSYQRLSALTRRSSKKVIDVSKNAVEALSDSKRRGDLFSVLGTASRQGSRTLFEQLTMIPLKTRLLLFGVVVLTLVIIVSITVIKVRGTLVAKRMAWEAEVTTVVQKKNQIEASMIYEDEEKARGLLVEVRAMIEALPAQNRSQKKERSKLAASLETLAQELQKRTPVDPTMVFNIPSELRADRLAVAGNTILAASTQQPVIVLTNNFGAETMQREAPGGIEGFRNVGVNEEGQTYAISTQGRVVRAERDGTLTELVTPPEARVRTIVDGIIYNNRLYTLDPFEKNILRFSLTDTTFGAAQMWLKNKDAMPSDARNLATDGSLYVLKQNGEVYQFNKGERTDFALSAIDPVFEKPILLQTHVNADSLFIADNGSLKRIAQFDKKGRLVRQFTSNGWNDLRAFAVDADEKRIYVLNGDRVESFGY